ncbi:MAG: deoxyribodipyrimidine photolyase [Vicinamibacteria bacterium]
MTLNQARLLRLNDKPIVKDGQFVLYWMQIQRRLSHNHSLDYAIKCANELGRPLVVYEGLRMDYPWASARLHQFILEGMRDNAATAKKMGFTYWPFVETPKLSGRGLLAGLAARSALVVTDDFPCFIVPGQSAALARFVERAVIAVDSNGVVPLRLLGDAPYAAAHLRPKIHKQFARAFELRSAAKPKPPSIDGSKILPGFDLADLDDPGRLIARLPIDQAVGAVSAKVGGSGAARARLKVFLKKGLPIYAEDRSDPAPPSEVHGSGLSPYLHFGHIGIEEVVSSVLNATGGYAPVRLHLEAAGKREGFFGEDKNANSFLDEALTWRDVGYVWHLHRREDTKSLETALPKWALATLHLHAHDKREFVYDLAQWESASTHDPLWNAAQRELVATGTIHNYLRMLWGKKVIEWSRTPEEAYQTLVHLNNKYALDGRNPNSYTGILWCFGLFDRPWAPQRNVLGQIRYMSSANTAKKFKLGPYLDWVATLPAPTSPAAAKSRH